MDLVTTQNNTQVQLFAGDFPKVVKGITLVSGAGLLTKGTVLGKITKGAASVAAAGGNTGDGVFTLDATTPILSNSIAGAYSVKCITAATNGGTFRVSDPNGNVLGDVAVAATFANQIKFSIADGDADFVVGDTFTVTIAAGSGKFKAYDVDNVDGTERAALVLAENADDATSADVATVAYLSGHFNEAALTGLDASAKVHFEGTSIFLGSVL